MDQPTRQIERPAERRTRGARHPSNIIFNLLALGLLLTVIVFLHQILKKPKQSEEQAVRSLSALPAETKPTAAPVENLIPETVAETMQAKTPTTTILEPEVKKPETPTVVDLASGKLEMAAAKDPEPTPQTTAKKQNKRTVVRADQEVSPLELDGDDARRKYIDDNRRLSSGDVKIPKPQRTAAAAPSAGGDLHKEAAKNFEPSGRNDLDDETARRQYLEENRRLSHLATDEGGRKSPPRPSSSGPGEYIPFESK